MIFSCPAALILIQLDDYDRIIWVGSYTTEFCSTRRRAQYV